MRSSWRMDNARGKTAMLDLDEIERHLATLDELGGQSFWETSPADDRAYRHATSEVLHAVPGLVAEIRRLQAVLGAPRAKPFDARARIAEVIRRQREGGSDA